MKKRLPNSRAPGTIGTGWIDQGDPYHVRRELPLVVLERDDEPLSGVGGEAHVDLLEIVRGPVLHFGRREVEVAKLPGPDHQDVGGIGTGRDPANAHLHLSADHVKVVGTEPTLCQPHVHRRGVAHVVQAVADHDVLALHQVAILDL